jgi:hypothetical protein
MPREKIEVQRDKGYTPVPEPLPIIVIVLMVVVLISLIVKQL